MIAFDARELRKLVLRMAYVGATVHIGCAFSIIEICAVLYRNHLRYPDNDPSGDDRDFFVLSKGHGVMAQYACLHEKGWLLAEDLAHYFGDGSALKGLSDAHIRGCEVTSGSLGHGLSVGVGLALSAKLKRTDQKCYAIIGDGEMNEGAIWEALLFSAHHRLDNLVVIVDENGLQAMGSTDDIMRLGSLLEKFRAFGFDAVSVDGHNESELDCAFAEMKLRNNGRPKAIVARTVKGRGVSFMENENLWHYTRLNDETFPKAISELGR